MNKLRVSSVVRRQFFSVMMVMTMVELANAASTMVDGLMAGRLLGPVELAAFGIAGPYYSVCAIVSGILMVSCQTMCARSIGSGRVEEASDIFSLCCLVGLISSVLLTAAGIAFAGPFAQLLGARGASAELLPHAKNFLIGLFVGTPANVLLAVMSPIVQLDGGGKRAAAASLAVAAFDVIGNVLFMVVFKWGLLGLGLGTSLSFYAAIAVLLTHFRKKDRLFHFRLKGLRWSALPKILSAGLPRGATQVCRTVGPILINAIVLSVAATAGLAALSVQSNLKLLLRSRIVGICGALMMMTGIYVGEQDKEGLKKTVSVALFYVVTMVCTMAAIAAVIAPLIAWFYLPDAPVERAMAVKALRWQALSLPFMALNMGAGNYLTALGRKSGAYLINIGNELVSYVLCTFLLGRLFGIDGVWAATAVSQMLTTAVFVLCGLLRRDTADRGIEKLLFLPKDFGVPPEDSISVTVTDMDGVLGLSEKIWAFCEAHGVDRRRRYLSALCIEEMAGNTVLHGFTKDEKKHSVDIRVIISGDDILLRLRDDCRRFDLKEKVKNWTPDPERPEENIGIRMVLGLAKDVAYTNTMNMNNLLITI